MASSSTSSSRPTIFRSLAIGFILFLAYEGCIRLGLVRPAYGIDNAAHEHFKADTIFAGSSLTYFLPVEQLDSRTRNLGMRGKSSQLGLEVMARSDLSPRTAVVELNMPILRGANREALDQLYAPVTYHATDVFASLRQNYKPMNVLLDALRWSKPLVHEHVAESVRAEAIASAKKENDAPFTAEDLQIFDRETSYIKQRVDLLRSKGWTVFLHYVPGDPTTESTTRFVAFRNKIVGVFPPGQYRWVPPMTGVAWRTNDGIHIVPSQAKIYAKYLLRYLDSCREQTGQRVD